MRELTLEESTQVCGGIGPAGALVGGVVGAVGAAGAAMAAGGNLGSVLASAAAGGVFGAMTGATGGIIGIAGAVRTAHAGFLTAGIGTAGGRLHEVKSTDR